MHQKKKKIMGLQTLFKDFRLGVLGHSTTNSKKEPGTREKKIHACKIKLVSKTVVIRRSFFLFFKTAGCSWNWISRKICQPYQHTLQ